jgi:hypothetical protein
LKGGAVAQAQSTLGTVLWKKIVRIALSIFGLLVLRAVLPTLPVLKNASAFDDSLLSPLVIATGLVDTAIFGILLGFGVEAGAAIRAKYTRIPELGKFVTLAVTLFVLLLAYEAYQIPTACLIESPTDLTNLSKTGNAGPPQAFADFIRAWQQAVQGLTADAVHAATGNTLRAYQRLAVAVLRQPPDLYGWTFLALIAASVIGMAIIISRNLDALTELVVHAIGTPARPPAGLATAGGPSSTGAFSRVPAPAEPSLTDAADKLTKLKGLLDGGIISKQDFETQKATILQRPLRGGDPDELRKLKSLLDAGALSEEEYECQKQRFLSQL